MHKLLSLCLLIGACRDASVPTTANSGDSAARHGDSGLQLDSVDTAPGYDSTGARDTADTADTADTDPWVRPMVPLSCTGTGEPDPLAGEPMDLGHTQGRVVHIDSTEFDQLCAIVTYPTNGESSWEEGAAVVVYVRPGITEGMETNPPSAFQGPSGVVEVLGVHPGLEWYGCQTSGEFSHGGDFAALAMSEVMHFALGQRTTIEGLRIDQLVNQPVCNSAITVASSSSGAPTATNALTKSPHLANRILGLVTFEPVSSPQFVQAEPGHIYIDPDDEVDGDGNGLAWDDGRNLSFDTASCAANGCLNDLSTLDWTIAENRLLRFWLDRNLDGVPSSVPDANGDGFIGLDEDFHFPDPIYTTKDGVDISMFSPGLIGAAWTQGLVDPENPPDNLPTISEANAFWAQLDQASLMPEALDLHHPDFLNVISWSLVPHHIPWQTRPSESVLAAVVLREGGNILFNPSIEAVTCLVDPDFVRTYNGGAELNEIVEGANAYDHFALPESFLPQTAVALAATGLLYEMVGPFDDCENLSLTLASTVTEETEETEETDPE